MPKRRRGRGDVAAGEGPVEGGGEGAPVVRRREGTPGKKEEGEEHPQPGARKRRRRRRGKGRRQGGDGKETEARSTAAAVAAPRRKAEQRLAVTAEAAAAAAGGGGGSGGAGGSLRARLERKLEGARFRQLNERLYTVSGAEALAEFSREPELFRCYHRGFEEQVTKWPENPLDIIIAWLIREPGLREAAIGDFGCGNARLAATLLGRPGCRQRVFSFDLVAATEHVTACDIANVPLEDATLDVAVYCLALMGTNIADFIREAHRVLKPGGILKIAEVRSRFEGGADSTAPATAADAVAAATAESSTASLFSTPHPAVGLKAFRRGLYKLGFDLVKKDISNKMFFMLELVKSPTRQPEPHAILSAKPCEYKRR